MQLCGVPRAVQVREVEDRVQLARVDVPREPRRVGQPDLADQHPARVLVRDRPPGPVDLVHVVQVGVRVRVVLLVSGREVGQGRVLGQQRGRIDPDAVDPAVEPEPEHVLELAPDGRAVPVEVGLLGREQVQVPLARRTVGLGDPGPAGSAEDRLPVVRRLVAARPGARPEPEPVPRGRPGPGRQGLDEPRVQGGAVIGDHVNDDLYAERVRLGYQRVRISQRAEQGINAPVVGYVVPGVELRRRVPGVEPDRVDTELGQVRQMSARAGQVADPVAARIGEAADVQLVDRGAAPPGIARPR
jgi:hypothetical protein